MVAAMRTFLAVEVPAAVRTAVAQQADRMMRAPAMPPDAVAWARPGTLHVTVKFFGETPDGVADEIRRVVGRTVSTRPAFEIDIQGIGAFPTLRAPRVLWAGVGGDVAALTALVESVAAAVVPLGFPREEQPFHPHLTLARVRRAHREVGRALDAPGVLTPPAACGRVAVDRVVLFRSERGAGGSVYTKLWDAALGG